MTSKSAHVVWKYAGDFEGKVLLVEDESKVQLFASFENEDTGEEFVHTFDRPEIVKISRDDRRGSLGFYVRRSRTPAPI